MLPKLPGIPEGPIWGEYAEHFVPAQADIITFAVTVGDIFDASLKVQTSSKSDGTFLKARPNALKIHKIIKGY
jgi:hypothetical protein